MKKYLTILCALVVMLCCLSSCSSNKTVNHFETVSDLLSAIKHDPYNYIDKEVQVKGTLCKFEGDIITALVEVPDPLAVKNGVVFRYEAIKSPKINIIISDEIMYTVIESGDYITACGIVRISNGELYLDNCTYTFNS